MRDSFETQCQDLRTKIGRSRRRLDHGMSQLVGQASGWFGFGQKILGRSRRTFTIVAAVGWGVLRWRRWVMDRRAASGTSDRAAGEVTSAIDSTDNQLAGWLDRWSRRCRIWAWRLRRPKVDRCEGQVDD